MNPERTGTRYWRVRALSEAQDLEGALLPANVASATFRLRGAAETTATATATTEGAITAAAAARWAPARGIIRGVNPKCTAAELEPVEAFHCSRRDILGFIGHEGESAHSPALTIGRKKDFLNGTFFRKKRFQLFAGGLKTEVTDK